MIYLTVIDLSWPFVLEVLLPPSWHQVVVKELHAVIQYRAVVAPAGTIANCNCKTYLVPLPFSSHLNFEEMFTKYVGHDTIASCCCLCKWLWRQLPHDDFPWNLNHMGNSLVRMVILRITTFYYYPMKCWIKSYLTSMFNRRLCHIVVSRPHNPLKLQWVDKLIHLYL